VTNAVPTVIVRASDERGQDVVVARVFVDGEPVAGYVEGRPFELDPGPHALRVEGQGRASSIQVVAREGDKARPVALTLPDAARPPPPALAPSRPAPPLVWIFGALGVATLGAFATFGLLGFEKHASLRHSCAPRCTSDDEAPIRLDYAIGDVSLGV